MSESTDTPHLDTCTLERQSEAQRENYQSPRDEDLDRFAQACKQFYFSVDPTPEVSRFIASTLAASPPSHRSVYTRIQSSLRSQAHLYHLRLRVTSFETFLNTEPAPTNRIQRRRLVQAFGRYCSAGTEPFFRGLWAALRLQSRGGAGSRRLIWEIDDAVFQESGGAGFMREAVATLKMLGFEVQPLTRGISNLGREDQPLLGSDLADENADEELGKPRLRLWVFPAHIDDQEAEELMGVLPSLLWKKRGKIRDARWPSASSLEEGVVVVEGTGRMWIGTDARESGWEGSRWFRVKRWLRALVGML